jgi:hypothetical protein
MAVLASALALWACRPAPAWTALPATPTASATRFAQRLAAAVAAHDAGKAAALYARDAQSTLVGEPGEARGRAAVARDFAATFARYRDARLTIGRIWAAPAAAVLELVFTGRRANGRILGHDVGGRAIGVAAALVVTFDAAGAVRTQRLYVDEVGNLAQLSSALVPAGTEVHAATTTVPADETVREARQTPEERRNLAVTEQIWAQLDAHDAARVMAPVAAGYQYDDFAAPRALDRAGTQAVVANLVAAIPDFRIAAKPVQLAAGSDVVTEMVEQGSFGGRPLLLHGLDIKRFVDGKVVHEWQYSNSVEILALLRGWTAPPAPPATALGR